MIRRLFAAPLEFYQARFSLWLDKRIKPAQCQKLDNRRLFIFPYRAGWGFIVLTFFLWLLGTNYENNLVLGLSFFLVSLFIVVIFHTFFNLLGLSVQYIASSPAFLGEDAEIELEVGREQQAKENIVLGFKGGAYSKVDLIDEATRRVKLFVPVKQRGWYSPKRLQLESYFPLGLLRCWSWLDLDIKLLVYPKSIASPTMPVVNGCGADEEGVIQDVEGAEDFHGFKSYQSGMSLKHIAWKQYARGQKLMSKEFVGYRDQSLWLDWAELEGDRERRLSNLCYWVLRLATTDQLYGLRLPGQEYSPSTGLEHKLQLLKALALFECERGGG